MLTYSESGLPASLSIDSNTGLISGTLIDPANTYPVTVTVTDQDALFNSVSFDIVISDGTASNVRLNSGGGAFVFGATNWSDDQYFSGGNTFTTGAAIADTENDLLYQSERWGNMFYEIPVTNGDYDVTLHFAEIFHSSSGSRVFNVDIEGGQGQLNNYDILLQTNAFSAIAESFSGINVADGFLTIDFTSLIDNAKISGIEVIESSLQTQALNLDAGCENCQKEASDLKQEHHASIRVYPNPATERLIIDLNLVSSDKIDILIIDNLGRILTLTSDSTIEKGSKRYEFDLKNMNIPQGIYILKLTARYHQFPLTKIIIGR